MHQLRARKVLPRTIIDVPLAHAGRRLLGPGAPWWEAWLDHPDIDDPFWDNYKFYGGLDHARIPVLLIGGWQDLFLEQTIEQYRRLRDRSVDVALTIGPWSHSQMMGKASPTVLRQSLDWLGRHFRRPFSGQPTARSARVHAFVTGGVGWRDLPDWPPDTASRTFGLAAGHLVDEVGDPGSSSFRFDPMRPTPTIGGRLLAPSGGYRRDDRLARRPDVLTFTSAPLTDDLHVYGAPVVELDHSSDNPHVDVFVRVSEVGAGSGRAQRSVNVSDGYRRFHRTERGMIRLELDEIAHRFRAGSRLRLLVAGASSG